MSSKVSDVMFYAIMFEHDVHGSVHRNMNLIERTNMMQPCGRIYFSVFLNWSTCFGRHTAHHQELKNVCKTRVCNYSFWDPEDERCVARNMLSNQDILNNKYYYTVASRWLFLWDLCLNSMPLVRDTLNSLSPRMATRQLSESMRMEQHKWHVVHMP